MPDLQHWTYVKVMIAAGGSQSGGVIPVHVCRSCCALILDQTDLVHHSLWHERNGLTVTGQPKNMVEFMNEARKLTIVEP